MSRRARPDPNTTRLSPLPGTHTRRALFRGAGVGVDDFRCCAHVEAEGEEEPNPTHSIVFVRRGVFVRGDRAGTLVADPNQVLFFNQGEPYRYAHPLPGGDDCTIVVLDDASARAALLRFAPRDAERPAPFRGGHAPSTQHLARLHAELLRTARAAPPLVNDDLLVELIDASLGALHRDGGGGRAERGSAAGVRRRREAVEAVQLVLNERFESPPRLAELAAGVGCSPFHLSRTFRAVTGLTLRQYLRRLRCRLASERLARGVPDLTSLALELGFCDHSHFTNAYRRELGVPPSRMRSAKGARRS